MKINFEYSWAYDMMLGEMMGSFNDNKIENSKLYLDSVRGFWDNNGDRIIREIESASKLKFKKSVDCFIVNSMFYESLSHPFTIKIEKDIDKLFAIFVHELAHILMVQNFKKAATVMNKVKGDVNYKVHFPVLLIERRVLEGLNKDYKKQKRVEDLDYVWNDVNKVYDNFKRTNRGIIPFLKENVASGQT